MAIDRAATVKKAESLLGEGKLDAAIAEYVRLVEDQPTDWSTCNTLGDLYVRAGDRDRAVVQYTQIADSQYRQGFVAKATAFYKKALRVKSSDEHSLAQLAAISAQQELSADAKTYLGLLLQQRRNRGDDKGVAECLIRIAALDEDNADAKLAAARAGKGHLDSERVARLFVEAAEAFERHNKNAEAKGARGEASGLEVRDPELRRRIEQSDEPAVVEHEAPVQPHPEASAVIPEPPASPPEVLVVETAEGTTLSFQGDAEAEAKVDLIVVVDDVAEIAPEGEVTPPVVDEVIEVVETVVETVETVVAVVEPVDQIVEPVDEVIVPVVEPIVNSQPSISTAPRVQDAPSVSDPPKVPSVPSPQAVSPDVKARFEEMLARTMRRPQAAEVQPPTDRTEPQAAGAGDVDAVAQLEAAAQTPSLQFQASAQLGRLLIGRGDLRRGVEWLERAVEAPVQIPEHAVAVLYEMADALERMGETARTLDVLRELEASAGTYRDVGERIARLERTRAGGSGA